MPYREITGDLIDSIKSGDFDIVAHSANCYRIMGAGIARSLRENFPEAYDADSKTAEGSYNKLGTISVAKTKNDVYIVNLYGQFAPGKNADILAIELGLKKIANYMKVWGLESIGLPMIGSGIGGLDWEQVKVAIKRQLNQFNVTIVKYHKDNNV